jgi:hypothetical protein
MGKTIGSQRHVFLFLTTIDFLNGEGRFAMGKLPMSPTALGGDDVAAIIFSYASFPLPNCEPKK